MLRGLEPVATAEEIEAAARQYVRKVSGVQNRSAHTDEAFERAVDKVAAATTELLAQLPPDASRRRRCPRCAAWPIGPRQALLPRLIDDYGRLTRDDRPVGVG